MGHEWKIGDWAEANGNRYFVYRVVGSSVFGVMESGTPSWDIACKAKHLPDCTGWDWEPLKPVEPTARKWEFGDWAHSPEGIVRFFFEKDGGGLCVSKDGRSHCFQFKYLEYLPDCTGFNWNDPVWNPVKPIAPPTGYRLLGRNETVAEGDLCIEVPGMSSHPSWRAAGGKSIGCTAGFRIDSYGIAAFARKIVGDTSDYIEPRYRPFANAAEFAPHRDRWVRLKSDTSMQMRVVCYNDRVVWIESDRVTGNRYGYVFDRFVFEDGTPFGVLDTKE